MNGLSTSLPYLSGGLAFIGLGLALSFAADHFRSIRLRIAAHLVGSSGWALLISYVLAASGSAS